MSSGPGQGSSSEGPLPTRRLAYGSSTPSGKAPSSSTSQPLDSDAALSDADITYQCQANRNILSSDEDIPQVYLSIVWQGGKLGVAHYDVNTTQVMMMPDTVETEEFQLLRRIIREVQPRTVVISTKSDERLIKLLQSQVSAGGSESGLEPGASGDGWMDPSSDYISMLPSIDFSLDMCKRRILAVNLASIPDHFTDSERTLYMTSLVPFDNVNMVRAVGGLLKLLEKQRVGVELESADVHVPVLSFQLFSLKDLMLIDESAYSALQIFSRESHPSVYKAGSSNSTKEGLSLFGIMNRCRTQIGSKLLRMWFLHPSRDVGLLRDRQEAIVFFTTTRNAEVTASLSDCLRNIKGITTAYNCIYISDICRAQAVKISIFKKIAETFTDGLHRIANLINKIVDFDESAVQTRFVVKPGVDPELDQKKRTYNGLPDFMTKVAKEELNKLSEDIKECTVMYLPQLGYLLAIPLCDIIKEENEYQLPGLDFVFLSNGTVHYRSVSTKQLDTLLGDTQCDITDHETSIMHKLQNMILEHSQVLLDAMGCVAQLDCLLALGACARDGNYVCPEMTTENVINIKAGRHPLQELCCSPFVPNDTLSGGENSRMKLLTGPNASGKSIYLKQVGLIVFLAHIGSFVPAEAALIGVTDAIYTRIKTLDSVSVGLSTFMIDLNQVSAAINGATSNSLVILDEFGKGTETGDGIALLCACLEYWLSAWVSCPHIFVSTHFHNLVTQNLLPTTPILQYQTMEVLHEGEELVFLYQLIEGATNSSYACHIAALAGLPAEITNRGSEVSDLLRRNQPVNRVDRASTEVQFKSCESVVLKFLDLPLESADLELFLKDVVIPAGESIH